MKKILIVLFGLIISFNSFSQDYKRDVHSVLKCITDNKMICDEQDVNFKFNINTKLSFFFLFDKENDIDYKIMSMDIVDYNMKDSDTWVYELIDENEKRYKMSLDEKKGTLILFPIYKLNDKKIKVESYIFNFNNNIKM